ncbi:hypothetical protein GmHk_07G020196 [Glycine max]|nr:hypothetical protein GmHk_07G020196 [Glycine max]
MPRTTPRAQPSLKSVLQNKKVEEKCDKAIAKWMIDASVSFNAVNSIYYQPIIDVISSMGPRNRLRQQNYGPINLKTLQKSPPFLTHEEMKTLHNNLANMSIQSTLDDIDKLNMDEDEDDYVPQPSTNTMEDVNPNESNMGDESHSFDEEGSPKVDPTLTSWI